MSTTDFPILDNHVHLDPSGRHIEAVRRFESSGGTHLIISHKPYKDLNVASAKDYRMAFDRTIELARKVGQATGVKAYATVGPYPVELLGISEKKGLEAAKDALMKGMEMAQEYVLEGLAVAIGEVGRPHFTVPDDVLEVSNEIMVLGMRLAKEAGCPVVLHTESAKRDDHIPGILEMSKGTGIRPEMIIKHFSPAKLADPLVNLGITPSIVARTKDIIKARKLSNGFLMETDYMDSMERPDAVLPPETVPRLTKELLASGVFTIEDVYRIHSDIPGRLYGISIE